MDIVNEEYRKNDFIDLYKCNEREIDFIISFYLMKPKKSKLMQITC